MYTEPVSGWPFRGSSVSHFTGLFHFEVMIKNGEILLYGVEKLKPLLVINNVKNYLKLILNFSS